MSGEKSAVGPVAPVVATVIGTGSGGAVPPGTVAITPGAAPNVVVQVVQPFVAVGIRAINTFLTTLVGLVSAGMATNVIPATDFAQLCWKCAALALTTAALGAMKDLVTVFGRLESKYPLLTGSV